MQNELKFSRFYIIESLRNGEDKTGEELFTNIFRDIHLKDPALSATFLAVENRQQFHIALTDIAILATKHNKWPYIHFEIHGRPTGLVLSNGDLISWQDLYYQLVKINSATRNNLFVSLATCFGAHIIKAVDLTKRSPFACYIGPVNEMYSDVLYANFHDFFTVLLETYDINKAVNALSRWNTEILYAGDLAENIFNDYFEVWLKRYDREEFKEEKINESVQEILKSCPNADVETIRSLAVEIYKGQRNFALRAIDYFLFRTDEYPRP